ncbi:hypothetical protein [Seonamhaeicola marinus]|nr:hypothetical protein [Seonamhaeicola marinus]
MKRYLCFIFLFSVFFASATMTIGRLDLQKNAEITFTAKESLDKQTDSLKTVRFYLERSDLNKNKGLYANAYEDLWLALLLAEKEGDKKVLATIHDELGVLYGIYGKHAKAIHHKKQSLRYIKEGTFSKRKDFGSLVSAYFNLAVQYRKAGDLNNGLVYLDSCKLMEQTRMKNVKENPFILSEKGIIFLLKYDVVQAESYLIQAKDIFEKNDKNYLVIIYAFLGDLYTLKDDIDKAIHYYEKSLNRLQISNTHTDFKTDVLNKIATLYNKKGELKKAYFYLDKSTKISDSLFGVRTKVNGQLFEIKDKYQEAMAAKDNYIKEQQHIIEKKKREQTQLLFVMAVIVFGLVFLAILSYHRSKVRKLKTEKESAAIKIKHDKEKLNAILETKSKELTVSALQLIEKDKNIEILLEALKDNSSGKYGEIQSKVVRGNKDLWESFNLRFTEVNTDFYKRLVKKHATLTPTEQKHCALIKLKFDSKEMAKLLNISVNSVHISRHRIRKKIGLTREDDLSNYIANI